jgi:hypothetical protein
MGDLIFALGRGDRALNAILYEIIGFLTASRQVPRVALQVRQSIDDLSI